MSAPADMPRYPNLTQRNGIYYFRRVIPKDLREAYGKREELISLKTRDLAQARQAYHRISLEVDQRIEEQRAQLNWEHGEQLQELTPAQLALIKAAYVAHILEEDEEARLEGFAEDVVPGGDVPPNPVPSWKERVDWIDALELELKEDYARGRLGVSDFWLHEAREVLSWSNVRLNLAPDSPDWRRAVRAIQEAQAEALRAIQKRNAGEIVPTPAAPANTAPSASSMPLLSSAVEEWLQEHEPIWRNPKTARDHRYWLKIFLEINGDRPLDTYNKADGRQFKSIASRLPANAGKKPALRGLSVQQIADKAEQLKLEPMATANLNKGIGRIDSFWRWAGGQYFDHGAPEPMKGLKRRENVAARNKRHPFRIEDLQRAFQSPIYTGCQSLRHWKLAGEDIPLHSYRYWLPLMALFSGARLGELCQLEPGDFREQDGITYFHIGGEGKQLKTPAAQRDIPVHPELIRLGLPALVQRRRGLGAKSLFEDFPDKPHAKRADAASKHFARFFDSVGIDSKKNTFHSFRHNFEDACRNAGMDLGLMNAVQGHAQPGMAEIYGDGRYRLDILASAVERISYPGLCLKHLRPYS